jgi:fatty-acyl-CoA synthase
MLGNCEPKALFYTGAFAERAKDCVEAIPDITSRLIREDDEQTLDHAVNMSALAKTETVVSCDPNRDQTIPVLIAFTSGTTGTPKGAVYTQDALTFTAINGNNTYNMRGRDNVLTFLPMFHAGGLLIHTLPAMHIGAQVTILESGEVTSILDEIKGNGVTLMLAPPAFSKQITSHPDWAKTDLSSLRGVGIGSTFIPPEIIQAWLDRGVPAHQNYGLTEGAQIFAVPWGEHRKRVTSAGTSMLYTQTRIVDENLLPLPPGEIGEIVLRGRSLFSGYWRNEEATNSAFSDGWFRTGDVAYRDQEGFFYIVDRKKSIVIVGSSNVYPADVERVLNEMAGIAESAVVGIPDQETGEALAACILHEQSKELDVDAILTHCSGQLAPYQIPKHILSVDDFPRTSLGKVKKPELKELILDRIG